MQRKKLYTLLVCLAAIVTFWNFYTPVYVGIDGTSVKIVEVYYKDYTWNQPSQVKDIVQKSNSLVVNILANYGCGHYQAIKPSATIDGNKVTLKWAWFLAKNQPIPGCPCVCMRDLQFRIPHAAGIVNPKIVIAEPDHVDEK